MFEIVIKTPDRAETVGRLAPGLYRIGSSPAAHLQISQPEVSARHALLTVKDNEVLIEDAGSTNGTFVDGKPVGVTPIPLLPGQVLKVGSALLQVRPQAAPNQPPAPAGGAPAAPAAQAATPVPGAAAAKPAGTGGAEIAVSAAHLPPAALSTPQKGGRHSGAQQMLLLSSIRYEYRKMVQALKRRAHTELLKRLNLKNLTLSGADQGEVTRQARTTVQAILKEMQSEIPRGVSADAIEEELVHEAVGLGPVEMLLSNPEITEVMINGHQNVYVEKAGTLYRTDLAFADDIQLLTIIERIVAPLGRRIDESQPLVDARLPDGSRVNAIIPPLAIDGPALTIRKFAKIPMTIGTLTANGTLTNDIADFLRLCVLARKNVLISGGTGSGKTTLLNIVGNFLPNNERIVTIEDAAELQIQKDHVIRLEARPPNIEGRGEIAIRDLVRNSLRMRPDRIVIGECRGGEALDMLQAMNTGHDGSLTTIHANTSRDALSRLETLVLMAGFDLPLRAIREQISSAISIIVQIGRLRDGTRRLITVSEVTGMEGEIITTQDIFEFKAEGVDANGRIRGQHHACGIVPTFLDDLRSAGIDFNMGIFQAN